MFRKQIKTAIKKAIGDDLIFGVELSDNPGYGDYSSNVALVLAKKESSNPKEVAERIKNKVTHYLCSGRFAICSQIEIAGPGFLNFFIAREALIAGFRCVLDIKKLPKAQISKDLASETARVRGIFQQKNICAFGKLDAEAKKQINIEFVSANPTGPLTMANGRGGFYGDTLANILEKAGHDVTREYYINDKGNQVRLLGDSILAAEGKIPEREDFYKGGYIKKLKGKTAKQAIAILLKEIKASLKKAGIKFDIWFSEDKNIHKSGAMKKMLKFLVKNKLVQEKEGALWLNDAVVVKSDKSPTYFLADLAYHYNKFVKRKFDACINVWGADHHGYVDRINKGVEALDIDSARLQIIVMQMVRLVSGGKEVKMSKRSGEFLTLDELIKMVGADAARWFFLERSPNTHMDFDLDLAKEQSKKNPVYYVQYAHARSCSILRKGRLGKNFNLNLLTQPEELSLIKKILQFFEIIEDIAGDYQVHKLPRYTYELAQIFTNFYEKHQVLYPWRNQVVDVKNKELTKTRIALVSATQKTLEETLGLMGIGAPRKM